MGRLSIDVTDREHIKIKTLATLQGKTIREYALERLLQPASPPLTADEAQAWQAFRLLMADRIQEADNDGISTRSLDEIFDDAQREMQKP